MTSTATRNQKALEAPPVLRQIRASAGSGKTYTLTTTFLEHLATASAGEGGGCLAASAQGHDWSDILAVTFTNRAASEMRERIILRLKKAVLGQLAANDPLLHTAHPWTPERAAFWLERILRHFSRLNVRTIDSLVHLLARMGALDLDLPPDFTPEFVSGDALAPLLDTLLEDARREPAFTALLDDACRRQLLHNREFRGFMNGRILRQRVLDTVPLLLALDPQREAALADADAVNERLAGLENRLRLRVAFMITLLEEERLKAKAHLSKALAKFQAVPRDWPLDSAMLGKTCLVECLLSNTTPPSDKAETAYAALCEAVRDLRLEGSLLRGALNAMPFLDLARVVAHALPGYFRAEGRIPASLLNAMALRLLQADMGVPQAFCRMGANLTHLLIDEFQDTSREQWQVLRPLVEEALSRGGSLTWVGDVKQAIYGWRGGDAALFDEVLHDEGLRNLALAPITDTLPTNWRSRGVIVRSNNTLFAKLAEKGPARAVLRSLLPDAMPESALEEAAIRVQQAFAASGQLEGSATGGCVRLVRLKGATAEHLNEQVREALLHLADELGQRRPWGDVAVLVRSNREASLAASWLMEHGVPVVTENSFLLADHPLIRQIMALLTFLDAPEDDIAFWTAATSELARPLIGLDDETLDDWLMTLPERRPEPLHDLFRQAFPQAWGRLFAPFQASATLLTPYDVVRELLLLCAVDTRFPAEGAFLRRFLEVLHRAELQGATTLARMVRYWKQDGLAEKAPMPESLDAVRIMTVHKSKGLQFPVVIVPWHTFQPRPDSAPRVLDLPPMTLVAPPSPALGKPYYDELADQAREALHLLYVAWTRPEDELYAFITRQPRNGRMADALDVLLDTTPFEGNLCQKGKPIVSRTPTRPPQEDEPLPHAPALQEATALRLSAPAPAEEATGKTTGAQGRHALMGWLPRLRIHRAPLERLAATPKRRGSFVHHCLACLHVTGQPQADAERAVARGLRTFPVLLRAPEMVEADIVESLAWYAALPEARLWSQRGVAEQTLIAADGSCLRADRVVFTETAITVIEYKTGAPAPAHAEQLSGYMDLLAKAQPLPVRGLLIYPDQRRLEPVTLS